MAKRTIDVLWGAPAPVCKGGEEEVAGQEARTMGGVLLGLHSL